MRSSSVSSKESRRALRGMVFGYPVARSLIVVLVGLYVGSCGSDDMKGGAD